MIREINSRLRKIVILSVAACVAAALLTGTDNDNESDGKTGTDNGNQTNSDADTYQTEEFDDIW